MTDYTELRELAEAATRGPWAWWTSNSWRRLKHDSRGVTLNVLEPYVCRDGHPDLSVSEEDMRFIAAANPSVIIALLDRLSLIRSETLEEAARAVETWDNECRLDAPDNLQTGWANQGKRHACAEVASAIRALKDKKL